MVRTGGSSANDMKTPVNITSPDTIHSQAVTVESWDNLFRYWQDKDSQLDWSCIFTLPVWLKSWWESFGKGHDPYICAVWENQQLIGIAPFMREGNNAHIMASPDLTDYTDLIVVPGQESHFLSILLTHLRQEGIDYVYPGQMRPDSSICSELKAVAQNLRFTISHLPAERIYEVALPRTWEDYLRLLSGRERHEIQRKLRRLYEAGRITYRVVEEKKDVQSAMDVFIRLFRSNTPEKAGFMDTFKESFFRSLAEVLADVCMIRLSFLDIDGTPAAATMCFDFRSTVYLYNNGYNEKYRALSVGLLSKAFSIRHSIELGRGRYDFLKGDEPYKIRLGGSPVQLCDCRIRLI